MKNISIIGIGKLGLCFALTLEKSGYTVLGVDINQSYVDLINNKQLSSSEAGVEELLSKCVNFRATTSIGEAVEHSDLLFVIVATPSLPNGRYDHSQVDGVVEKLKQLGRQQTQKHFVVCCTTMPGYCDSITRQLNELNYTVSYNPEFIAQGTILRDQANPDMVLIGEANKEVGDMIQSVYERHTLNQPRYARMSPLEAEITKLSLNCFLTTKIAYANMVGDIVRSVGGNPDTVLSAIGSDSRIGNKYLRYGYGYGGPCCEYSQLVQTNKGLKPIGEIQVGDKVLTHKGRYRTVTHTYERPFEGIMFKLTARGNNNFSAAFTAGHPIYLNQKNEFDFLPVEELSTDSKLALPKINLEYQPPFQIKYQQKRPTAQEVSITVTPELMKLFGLFLSEGCVSNSNKNRKEDRIIFTFSEKEMDYALFVKEMFQKYFNRKVMIKNKKGQNSIAVVSKNIPFAKWLLEKFGKGAKNKKVPYEWLGLPDEFLHELLKGIWYGDGSKSDGIYTLGLVSRELINFVRLSLLRFGIAHTIRKVNEKIDKNNVRHKESYYIRVSNPLHIKKLSNILTEMQINRDNFSERKSIWVSNDHMIFSIKNIEQYQFKGNVYNLEVEEDHSYMLESCVAHNCFPRDNRALAIFASDINMPAKISEATDLSNKLHLEQQVRMYMKTNQNKEEQIIFDYVSYKPESTMLLESQQLAFAVALAEQGYNILIHEREEVIEELRNKYKNLFSYKINNKI